MGRIRSLALSCFAIVLCMPRGLPAAELLYDDFTVFSPGTTWQAHGLGLPDQAAAIVGLGADGSSLRLGSSPGSPGDYRGIETITPISLVGLPGLRVDVRLHPLNQTPGGNGGGSRASIAVAVLGSSGEYVQASAGANRPEGAARLGRLLRRQLASVE